MKTPERLVTKFLLAMAMLAPELALANETNETEEVTYGKIYIGDTVINLDDAEAVAEFNTNCLTIDKRMMGEDHCVVLTLNGYEYEGTGVNGVGGIKYSGINPLVLDLNGENRISVTGDPNNEGATAGVFGQILVLTGDGSLEVNMTEDVHYAVGVMARVLLSTSPYVIETLDLDPTAYKFFTGKVTVNNHGENSAIGIYPVFEGYLGGGEYELNITAEGESKIGLSGGLKLMTDATQINVNCPHGRGLAVPSEGRFVDTTVEVNADCAYFSTGQLPTIESTQAGVEYLVLAGNDAQSAVTIDLEAADAIETLQAAKYLKICESNQIGTSLHTLSARIAPVTPYGYNLMGQRVKGIGQGPWQLIIDK